MWCGVWWAVLCLISVVVVGSGFSMRLVLYQFTRSFELVGFAKYSTSDARIIAERVYNKYGSLIEEVADRYGISPEWLVGMTGMENPNCYEWSGVFFCYVMRG